jgi:hypothetical protein
MGTALQLLLSAPLPAVLNELYKGEWKALDDRFNAWLEPAHKALPATVLDSAAAVHAKWWIVSRQLGGSSSAWNAVLKHAVESTGINLSIDVHV